MDSKLDGEEEKRMMNFAKFVMSDVCDVWCALVFMLWVVSLLCVWYYNICAVMWFDGYTYSCKHQVLGSGRECSRDVCKVMCVSHSHMSGSGPVKSGLMFCVGCYITQSRKITLLLSLLPLVFDIFFVLWHIRSRIEEPVSQKPYPPFQVQARCQVISMSVVLRALNKKTYLSGYNASPRVFPALFKSCKTKRWDYRWICNTVFLWGNSFGQTPCLV